MPAANNKYRSFGG